jgi:hypothetical protein
VSDSEAMTEYRAARSQEAVSAWDRADREATVLESRAVEAREKAERLRRHALRVTHAPVMVRMDR